MSFPVVARPEQNAVDAVISELRDTLRDGIQTGETFRAQHASSATWISGQPPDGVASPYDTEEVQKIVLACARHRVPVVGFGVGTSLEGQVNAPAGGISVDFKNMAAVLEINQMDMDCRVQPGITRRALNEHLRDTGLFFPVDPGADASLGGMASTRASGTNAVRYGTMRDVVMGFEVVLPDGSITRTGGRARKSAAGYDLTRLLIGAEGTLGLITDITLRLNGIPEAISAAVCHFPDVESACAAVIETIQTGIPVARIELLDTLSVQAVNAYSKLALAERPLLLLEFHGSSASVAEQSETFGGIADEHGASGFEWTAREEERNRLWRARHDAYWACRALVPEAQGLVTDVCVPVSSLAECVVAARKKADELKLVAPILGHVGDGNFHVTVLFNGDDVEEVARAQTFNDWLTMSAIAMGGTCTGEHGIGQGKAEKLRYEAGAEAIAAMRAIKLALDPQNIMNPGKILSTGNY